MSDWEVFKEWSKLEGTDIDDFRLQWGHLQVLQKSFENDKKQNAFNYLKAIENVQLGAE
ncbi:hypothetical protein JDS99_05405 [Bacillus cereus group sp. N6]|uniref:hypothetical protein n=1 Tax=Bacillus cereus group sp. N6 TaxID=2794583 RepID=UPI0018F45E10|nr:hypothetical protein [Bacillus cereus group sp. N6]MBJ8109088.1 hypothetical protein [Bacillus cereus group sp. N6]